MNSSDRLKLSVKYRFAIVVVGQVNLSPDLSNVSLVYTSSIIYLRITQSCPTTLIDRSKFFEKIHIHVVTPERVSSILESVINKITNYNLWFAVDCR